MKKYVYQFILLLIPAIGVLAGNYLRIGELKTIGLMVILAIIAYPLLKRLNK